MLRLLIIAFTALATALSLAVGYVFVQELDFKASRNMVAKQQRAKSAPVVHRPQPPPPPPPFSPEEIATIRHSARPEPPVGTKDDLGWQQVEQIFDRLRKERTSRPQATADLERWYAHVSRPEFTASPDYPRHLEELGKWRAEMPDSPTPLVVMGLTHIEHGWQARGSGFAHTVTPEGFRLFDERLAEAQRVLQQAVDMGVKDGEAHTLLISVAKGRGLPKPVIRGLLEQGIQTDATYMPLYTSIAHCLLPRWHGEPGEVERLANDLVTELPGDDGLDAFGHIAYKVNQSDPHTLFQGEYDRALLAKAGDVLVRRYAQDPNLVAFAALLAYAAQDHAACRRAEAFLPPDEAVKGVPNWNDHAKSIRAWCAARQSPNDQTHYIWAGRSPYGNIAFDSDPRYLWCGDGWSETPVELIDVQTGRTELSLEGPRASLNDLTFDGAKSWLAAITYSPDFKGWVLWNTKAPEDPLLMPVDERMQAIALSPTNEQLALGYGQRVELFDLKTRIVTANIELGTASRPRHVHFLHFSPDGKKLAVNEVICDTATGAKLFDLMETTRAPQGTPPKIIVRNVIGFDRENRPLVRAVVSAKFPLLCCGHDGRSWETVIADLGENGHATAISSDFRLLAIADQQHGLEPIGITIWNLETGKRLKRLGGHWRHIGHMTFAPDSKTLASIELLGGVIKLWSMEDVSSPKVLAKE